MLSLSNGKGKARDVLFVDGLKHNLLSVSQICDKGCEILFTAKDCRVNPWTWVTLFGKRISAKAKKCTSTEVLLSPRPRFYQALDRGFFQPSVEVFINPRSRFHTSTEGFKIPRPRVYKYLDRGTSVQ